MGQLADSLREIIQTMKDGDEIFRQDIKNLEKSANELSKAADALIQTYDLIED
tara:strand:- start:2982 stop:3140 length:159 start_codon:yes stop_codon:yes gene_type:complete